MNNNPNLNASQTPTDLAKQIRAQIRLGQFARQLAGPAGEKIDLQEYLQRSQRDHKRHEVWSKAYVLARQFWKQLVETAEEPQAREIMRLVMGDKKPGRPPANEENAFKGHIYFYFVVCGPNWSDEKIAKRINANNPYYAKYTSGMIVVLNNEITESTMASDDDPIVGRRPIKKSLGAIKKEVQRFRRWAIIENLLQEEYTPRPYYHD